MEILRAYQTKNRSYSAKKKAIDPVGILVHSTGATNKYLKRWVDAEERLGKNQYNNHWNQSSATKSMHAFIGYDKDKKIIVAQTLPYDRACWGCGSGSKGSYNYNPHAYLQFEICQSTNVDEAYYWEVIAVAEEYCAHLCHLYGWGVDHITSHKEAHIKGYASNHGDPQNWMKHFGDNMDKFRARVAARLGEEPVVPDFSAVNKKEPVETTGAKEKKVMVELKQVKNGSKCNEVKTVQRLLNAMDYNCGEVDGSFGAKTLSAVKDFQKVKGLSVDGIVGAKTWAALLK